MKIVTCIVSLQILLGFSLHNRSNRLTPKPSLIALLDFTKGFN